MPQQMDFARNPYHLSEERWKYSCQREVSKVDIRLRELSNVEILVYNFLPESTKEREMSWRVYPSRIF